MEDKKVRTTVYISKENFENFKKYSDESMIPMSRLVDVMIKEFLQKKENE